MYREKGHGNDQVAGVRGYFLCTCVSKGFFPAVVQWKSQTSGKLYHVKEKRKCVRAA